MRLGAVRPLPLLRADEPQPIIVRRKLQVGSESDPAEREADAVADRVVRVLWQGIDDAPPNVHVVPSTRVQFAARSGRHEPAAGRCGHDPSASPRPVSRVSRSAAPRTNGGFEAPPDVEARIRRARSSGSPLEEPVRRRFEAAMNTDLTGVRIHTGGEADQLNRQVSARAFTTGNHVFFSSGSYAPERADGARLLAHELAHTTQQEPTARRSVIRRFSLQNPDFTKTTKVVVFQKGGSGNVARFDDGSTPLIVKVDQLVGNEVAVANTLHEVAGRASGMKDYFSVTAPGSRLATAHEKAAIKKATSTHLDKSSSPRNFVTGLDSKNPTILMEMGRGRDFSDILKEGGHFTTDQSGALALDPGEIVTKLITTKGPLNVLARSIPVDIAMGMTDRLIRYWNPDNFTYHSASRSFVFVDNTQNWDAGFLTTVDMGQIVTHKDAFDQWAQLGEVKSIVKGVKPLAQQMFRTVTGYGHSGGILGAKPGKKAPQQQRDQWSLLEATIAQNQKMLIRTIEKGLKIGLATVLNQLKNPLPFVASLPPQAKHEAVHSLLARRLVLTGMAPQKAWQQAGAEAARIAPAPPPRPNAPAPSPLKVPANMPPLPSVPTGVGTTTKG